MKKLVLIGGGGHCISCIDVIEQCNEFEIIGITDSDKNKQGTRVLGYEIIGTDDDLPEIRKKCPNAFITAGHMHNVKIRERISEILNGFSFTSPVIISPTAYVSAHASIGPGTIIMHKAFVNASTRIGSHCIINTAAHIEHGCTVENLSHISTQAVLNGDVKVGSRCFIGSNSTVVNQACIPSGAFIKAGTLVKKNAGKL